MAEETWDVLLAVLFIEGVLGVWFWSAASQVRLHRRASQHRCHDREGNVGCIACVAYGAEEEREAILTAINNAPPAFDFFGPYIPKDKLVRFLTGEKETK